MKIEQQVCTWKQGMKLHQLGVKKNESYFQWMECLLTNDGENFNKWWAVFRPNNGEHDYMTDMDFPEGYDGDEFETSRECAAFTVAELGVMFPNESGVRCFESYNNDHIGAWYCESRKFSEELEEIIPPIENSEEGETEAEARAAMIIWLLENKLTTPEEVNKRLNF